MTKDIDIDMEIEADEVAYIYLGTDKHNNLKNLDLPDSHPIKAITGLQEVVDKVGRTEDGAEVNEIVGVRVNGVPLDIAGDRTVDVAVPTSYGYTLDLDGETGIISLKDRDGVVLSTIDTNLERIVESGYYDADTNELVLVLDDNSEIRIDASKLVDVYTADGETIVESGHVFALSPGSKDALKNSADHIADRSNPHNVTKDQVGLSNVDNTSDMSKPISTLVQQALDRKADDSAVVHTTGNEDIAGQKTFNNMVGLKSTIPLQIINTSMPLAEGASYTARAITVVDSNNKEVCRLVQEATLTQTTFSLVAYRGDSSSKFIVGVNDTQGAFTLAPSWSVGTNDNSDKVMTMKMANSLPSLVHTTGNETISGTKTFTSDPIVETTLPLFTCKNTGIPDKALPTTQLYGGLRVRDVAGNSRGAFRVGCTPTGNYVQLYAYNTDGTKNALLYVGFNANDNVVTYAPSTSDSDGDNAIVTKKYLLDKIAALEARIATLEAKP